MHRLLCALILGLPLICSAQLSGHYTYDFTTRPLLWDFSGTYALTGGELQIVNVLTNLPSGTISGAGQTVLDSFFSAFQARANIETGRVLVANRRLSIDVKGKGPTSGRLFAHDYTGEFHERLTGHLDPTNRTIIASINNASCQPDHTCDVHSSNVVFHLPGNMNGTWSLTMDLATSNKVILGTASVELSNGRTLDFNVSGPTAKRVLRLQGTGEAARTKLTVNLSTNGELRTLKGKLFGQNLVFP